MKFILFSLVLPVLLIFSVNKTATANEPALTDARVEIVRSTNTAGAVTNAQYSVIVQNTGTSAIEEVYLNLHSTDAEIALMAWELIEWTTELEFSWYTYGKLGPFSLQPKEAIHLPFFASIIKPGLSASIHAELEFSGDENPLNNESSAILHRTNGVIALEKNGVVAFEAESFSFQWLSSYTVEAEPGYRIPAWHLHSVDVPSIKQPDPDDASPSEASNGAYIEALPDVRLNDDEDSVFGISNFDQTDTGPFLAYQVYIEEPGRY